MLSVFDLLLGIPLTSLERGFWPANLEDTEKGLQGRVEIWGRRVRRTDATGGDRDSAREKLGPS